MSGLNPIRGRYWILLTVIVFAFLGGSVFFFFGAVLSLVRIPVERGDIAVVEVLGGIYESKSIVEKLGELKKDDDVKAVVLRIDSPGGSVSASQEIFESVKELRAVKPVVASMGTVAASGGYYIAAPANKIIANPGTLTGSIGVRLELMNVEDLLQWARLRATTLKSGRLKDVGSSTRPMTDEEREYLEGILREMHMQFKKAVAESRGLSLEDVEKVADGRVLTGEQALAAKLIDELGSLERASKVAAELGGIKGEPDIFYPSLGDRNLIDYLIEGTVDRLFSRVSQVFLSPLHLKYGL